MYNKVSSFFNNTFVFQIIFYNSIKWQRNKFQNLKTQFRFPVIFLTPVARTVNYKYIKFNIILNYYYIILNFHINNKNTTQQI